jgi:hypothetical protein
MDQPVHLENEREAYARDVSAHGRAHEPSPPSQRSHPYNRRPSLPLTGSRIPDDGTPRAMPIGPSINIPGISSFGNPWDRPRHRDGYWEERPRPMARTVSGDRGPHIRLPPLHSLGSSDANGGMAPPPRHDPPSPRSAYSRPPSPRLISAQDLRPSYPSHHSDSAAGRMPSPPLRSVHNYGPRYPPSPEKYYPSNGTYNGNRGYPHVQHDMHARPANYPMYPNPNRRPEEEKVNVAGAGQSRRLAHLMSEQKRRE